MNKHWNRHGRKVGWGSEEMEEEETEAKETATLAEAQFPLLPDPFLMTRGQDPNKGMNPFGDFI